MALLRFIMSRQSLTTFPSTCVMTMLFVCCSILIMLGTLTPATLASCKSDASAYVRSLLIFWSSESRLYFLLVLRFMTALQESIFERNSSASAPLWKGSADRFEVSMGRQPHPSASGGSRGCLVRLT